MISVLLVDDHGYVLRGLQQMLEATDDMHVMGTASNGVDAIAQVQLACPEVAVIDISMPLMDGIETARELQQRCPQVQVLVLSIYDHAEYVQRALDVGVSGFVLKEEIGEDLLAAIRTVHSGGRYFSHRISGLADQYFHE